MMSMKFACAMLLGFVVTWNSEPTR